MKREDAHKSLALHALRAWRKIGYAALFVSFWASGQVTNPAVFSLADLGTFQYFVPNENPTIYPGRSNEYFIYSTLNANGGTIILKQRYKKPRTLDTLFSERWLQSKLPRLPSLRFILSPSEDVLFIITGEKTAHEKIKYYQGFLFDVRAKKRIPLPTERQWVRTPHFSPQGTYFAYITDQGMFGFHLGKRTLKQLIPAASLPHMERIVPPLTYLEGFHLKRGIVWSHDERFLFFYESDYTQTPTIPIVKWDTLYPEVRHLPYPFPGQTPPTVHIKYYDFHRNQFYSVPLLKGDRSGYLPRIYWSPYHYALFLVHLDRRQKKMTLWRYSLIRKQLKPIYTEEAKEWMDHFDKWKFSPTGRIFFLSDESGRMQLYVLNPPYYKKEQLTHSNIDIDEIVGIDENKGDVYFLGYPGNLPIERHLYRVPIQQRLLQAPVQITDLGFSVEDVHFSLKFTYYIIRYSNINTPPTTKVFQNQFPLWTIEDNALLRKRLRAIDLPYHTFFSFSTPNGHTLHGQWIAPPNLNYNKKYPVVFDVYNGPNSKHVVNRWRSEWFLDVYMALHGFVIVQVDGRGTKGQGAAFKKALYKELGRRELNDIIYTATYLTTRFPFMDSTRIGIMGHSYGGYLSALAIMRYPHIFRAAVSIAPVTDWHLYNAIYTERYMDLPRLNERGYRASSVLNEVPSYQGGLLLVHGAFDHNVPVLNSYELVKQLNRYRKDYVFYVYPRADHSFLEGTTRSDLYLRIYRHFTRLLRNEEE